MRCTDVGQKPRNIAVGHAVPLRKIAERGAELAVRTTVPKCLSIEKMVTIYS